MSVSCSASVKGSRVRNGLAVGVVCGVGVVGVGGGGARAVGDGRWSRMRRGPVGVCGSGAARCGCGVRGDQIGRRYLGRGRGVLGVGVGVVG